MSGDIQRSKIASKKIISAKWQNEDAIKWYKNVPISFLRDYAIRGGLEEGCDINILYPYISNTRSLIEVGSGYGRVLRHLIRKGYSGKIFSIEYSENFYKYLKKNYSDKAEIFFGGIQNFKPKYKVEAILWLWSGLGDFSKDEHLPILKHMCAWLKPDGIFVIETLLHTLVPKNDENKTKKTDQNFIVSTEYGNIYMYLISNDEIQMYGDQLGFKYIKHIDYETDVQRHRILHIFSNKHI